VEPLIDGDEKMTPEEEVEEMQKALEKLNKTLEEIRELRRQYKEEDRRLRILKSWQRILERRSIGVV
jgi:hypothetical protein